MPGQFAVIAADPDQIEPRAESIAGARAVAQLGALDHEARDCLGLAVEHGHAGAMRVHLRRHGRKEAAARIGLVFDVAQEVLGKLAQAFDTRGRGEGGLDDELVEQGRRRIDGRKLQLLLRPEMRKEPALAHPDRLCKPADREPADALNCRELSGFAEDRLATPLAVAPPPPFPAIRLPTRLPSAHIT